MSKITLEKWYYYHWFAAFFEDFKAWLEEGGRYNILEDSGILVNMPEKAGDGILQEYDELFKGVNANIHIPLWASACKADDTLLNQTTLEIIMFYYKWGYKPVDMDGNPPDFIGQQLRFMEYLAACGLNASGRAEYERAAKSFESLYLLDTVAAVAEGIKRFSDTPLFVAVAELLTGFFGKSARSESLTEDNEALLGRLLSASCFGDVYKNGRLPEIPIENEAIINTGGRNNCGGKCVIRVKVREGCVLGIDTDCGTEAPQLRACVKGRSYRKTFLNEQRLRYPMRRVGERGEGKFERITWDAAADIISEEWLRIKEEFGPSARFVNYATGVNAVVRPDALSKRLLALDGGYLDRYNSYSSACTRYVTPYIYGDIYSGNSIEDVLNTKLLILWGHNPVETIFGTERNYYLSLAKEKGIRIIVVDPRFSDTAVTYADQWLGIIPSTDGALADAMAYVIWSEELHNKEFMDKFCVGFDEEHMPEGIPANLSYRSYLFGERDGVLKTAEWASGITGIPAETIKLLAREYATTKPACLLPGLGIQRIGNGEQTVRGLAMLACLTGNVGIKGGGAAGAGVVREHKEPVFPVGKNPFPGKIPCFMWTTAVENGVGMTKREHGLEGVSKLETNMKMMVNLAGNTLVNQHSDINNTVRILKDANKCRFIICSDIFMTSSAKFADILLPAPSFLESENMSAPWDFGSYLIYNNQAIEPLFGCRFEYEWLEMVAERIGLKDEWTLGHEGYKDWLKTIYEGLRKDEEQLPEFDDFKKAGGYRYKNSKPYIAYSEQIADFENNKFDTPSGKIEVFSRRLYELDEPEHIPAIPRYAPCPEGPEDSLKDKYPIQLIGWHTKRRCHSIHDNNQWLEEVEPQLLWINPRDAAKRGIADGDLAEVFNDRGRLRIGVYVTERIIEGVAALPQGAWYTPDKNGTDTRGSINVLTSTRPTPLAKGNPQHTNLVEIVSAKEL